MTRLEPDPETLWAESRSQVDLNRGLLILDDSTLEKPYSRRNDLVYRHWSGNQKEVVSGINLITLLWTEGDRCVPVDDRVFDKDRDRKTKNDHFSEMLLHTHDRGFNPETVCFDNTYFKTYRGCTQINKKDMKAACSRCFEIIRKDIFGFTMTTFDYVFYSIPNQYKRHPVSENFDDSTTIQYLMDMKYGESPS